MELVKRWGIASGAGEQEDWLAWYVGQTGEQPNYSTLLERLATTQTERRAIIQGFLETSEDELEEGLKLPIYYSHGDSFGGGSYNEALTVNTDDQSMYLKTFGMAFHTRQDQKLSQEGGAETLWGLLIAPLQRNR